MTDKEKLSAVRAEIEMRKESLKPHGGQGLVVTRLMRELCDDSLSFIDSIPEDPQVKESEETQHVKEMCKENGNSLTQEPVSKIIFDGNFNKSWFAHPELAFTAGAKWQKEQMMKNAVSAKVTEIYYPTDSCLEIEATLPEGRFKDGDKVLIIKED